MKKLTLLLIALLISLYGCSEKEKKKEDNNIKSQEKSTEISTEENNNYDSTDKEIIKKETIDRTNKEQVAEKFIESVIVLRSDDSNKEAMNRVKELSTKEYSKQAEKIFSGRNSEKILKIVYVKAEKNEAKTKQLGNNREVLRVDYLVNIKGENKKVYKEESNFTVSLVKENGKYSVENIVI
ncbi:hypothetical protein [Macrococcus armenti]|uniref:hypothetical protein n=1 Tax=Macrococcus armenti TaxID=2875764 RepID=UPI001CCAA3B2|nr:hypothetical protein [Macrococcus armenti]UBH09803.1 hypothetical protein LAU41_11800 [Macrococcus armenti]